MFTEGICQDGAAILNDGVIVTIDEILQRLNDLDLYKGLLVAEQEDCDLQRKSKIANWERAETAERYGRQLTEWIEVLYQVRNEPDKMLCLIERYRQFIKSAE